MKDSVYRRANVFGSTSPKIKRVIVNIIVDNNIAMLSDRPGVFDAIFIDNDVSIAVAVIFTILLPTSRDGIIECDFFQNFLSCSLSFFSLIKRDNVSLSSDV